MHDIDFYLTQASPSTPLVTPSSIPVSNEKPRLPFPCDVEKCGKEFKKKYELKRHQATIHNLNIDPKNCCTHCPKAYSTQGQLKRHMLTHTKEKPFLCLGCGKKFAQKYHLTRHAKNSDCALSSISATSPSQLIQISGSKPIASSVSTTVVAEKPIPTESGSSMSSAPAAGQSSTRFHCDFPNCDKDYPEKFTLNRHKRTHSEAKLCCDFPSCGKKFYENYRLKHHKMIHNPQNASKKISQRKRKSSHISQGVVNQTNKKHNVEKDSNSHGILTKLARPIETFQPCSTTTTTSEEFKNLSSARIFDGTSELPFTPLNSIPQSPLVIETNIIDTFQPFSPLSLPGEIENLPSTPSMSLGIFELPEIFGFPPTPQNPTVIPAEQGISEITSADTSMNSHSSSRPVHDLDKENTMNSLEIKQAPKPVSHNGRFYCDFRECNKSFPKKFTLTRHKKTHGEGQFCCTCCGKKFHENSGLQRHMKTYLHSNASLPQTPTVILTAQPATEVKIAISDQNQQEIQPAELSSSRARPIQKNKNRKKCAFRSNTELTSMSNTRDAMIFLITTSVKPIISLMVYALALSPELREKQISSGFDSVDNMIFLLLSKMISNHTQLKSQVSLITDTIRNLLFKILVPPLILEKCEFQIAEVMDLLKSKLYEMSFFQPPSPSISAVSSESSSHQHMESSLPTHAPKKTTDTSSLSRNSCALFGIDQSPQAEEQTTRTLSEIRTQYSQSA